MLPTPLLPAVIYDVPVLLSYLWPPAQIFGPWFLVLHSSHQRLVVTSSLVAGLLPMSTKISPPTLGFACSRSFSALLLSIFTSPVISVFGLQSGFFCVSWAQAYTTTWDSLVVPPDLLWPFVWPAGNTPDLLCPFGWLPVPSPEVSSVYCTFFTALSLNSTSAPEFWFPDWSYP